MAIIVSLHRLPVELNIVEFTVVAVAPCKLSGNLAFACRGISCRGQSFSELSKQTS